MRCLRTQIHRCRFYIRPLFVAQIAHLHVEPRVQIGYCSLSVEPRIHGSGCDRLSPDILKKSFYVEVLKLEIRRDVSISRHYRRARAEISPNEWDRCVTEREFGCPLIELNLANLKRFPFCPSDRLKIHVVAGKKDNWHIETVGRISRVDIRPE